MVKDRASNIVKLNVELMYSYCPALHPQSVFQTNSYLFERIKPLFGHTGKSTIFQQENARLHIARASLDFMEIFLASLIPDLSPVDHV